MDRSCRDGPGQKDCCIDAKGKDEVQTAQRHQEFRRDFGSQTEDSHFAFTLALA
jgi:hypothetical protein